jgi:hypothetical protein
LILIGIFTYNSNTLFPSYNALLPSLGAALIIYAGTAQYSGFIFRFYPIRFIGLISYSLYLIHWPLIIFYKTYNQEYGLNFDLNVKQKFIVLLSSFLFATLMYYLIEQPFRKTSRDNKYNSPPPITTIMKGLSLAFILAAIGTLIFSSKGWLWRANYPEILTKIDDLSKYHVQNWGGAEFTGGLIHQGKNQQAQILLIGDSHAGMLDEGIVNTIAKPEELTVFTISGGGAGNYASSLLLPGTTRLNKNQNLYDTHAEIAHKEILDVLNKSKPKMIIISAAWTQELNVGALLIKHTSFNIDTSTMSSYDNYQLFINVLDEFLSLIGNTKLVIIGDVPGSTYNVTKCWGSLKWLSDIHCQSKDDVKTNGAALNVNKILEMYAKKHKNVYFLNPYDIFCKNNHCSSIDSASQPYYSDGTHLSKTGSIFLMDHFKEKIMRILDL